MKNARIKEIKIDDKFRRFMAFVHVNVLCVYVAEVMAILDSATAETFGKSH